MSKTLLTDPPAPESAAPIVPPADAAAVPATPPADATVPPAEPPPVVEYTLALPEHSVLDAAAIERTVAIAREQGLSPAHAQAALNLANTEATALRDATLAAYQPGGAEHAKIVEGWQAETLADPALGATPEARQATIQRAIGVIDRFAVANPAEGTALKQALNDTGFGSKREVVRFMAWLGESAREGTIVQGDDAPPPPKSVAARLYPNLPQ